MCPGFCGLRRKRSIWRPPYNATIKRHKFVELRFDIFSLLKIFFDIFVDFDSFLAIKFLKFKSNFFLVNFLCFPFFSFNFSFLPKSQIEPLHPACSEKSAYSIASAASANSSLGGNSTATLSNEPSSLPISDDFAEIGHDLDMSAIVYGNNHIFAIYFYVSLFCIHV